MRGSVAIRAAVLGLLAAGTWTAHAAAVDQWVFFGTYTGNKGPNPSKGIYVSRYKAATGELSDPVLAAEAVSPSYLTLHPNQRVLYSNNETKTASTISAYSIEAGSGKLTLLNRVPSGGPEPCMISLDKAGKFLMVANFTGGTFGVIRLQEDGSLGKQTALVKQEGSGPNPQWQTSSRVHWAGFSPDGRFVLVMNLGNDKVYVYRFDAATGTVTPNEAATLQMPAGYGPRTLLFHPNGKVAYLVNQLGGTLIVYQWDPEHGLLHQLQEVSLMPPGFNEEFNGGEEVLDRDAKFLYVACRGSDTLAVFAVNPFTGLVTLVQHESSRGMSPRHIALDPAGGTLWVANQYTDNLIFLGINNVTGRLKRTIKVTRLTSIAYIQFVPAQ